MVYDLEEIRSHYRELMQDKPPDYYERFDPFLLDKRPIVNALVAKTFERHFPRKAGRLLDVGCGTCFYFPLLAQHAESVTGVDLCVPMLEQARELIRAKGITNCEVRESSALALPFGEREMDVVHSWDFLHHVPDVPKALEEVARVLKPGGRYIAVEPNVLNPSIAWYHARRRSEWGLFSRNQFRLPGLLRRHFDVEVRYDNTIISFLNERTHGLWKAINAFTSVPPFHLLSFRYTMQCTRKS